VKLVEYSMGAMCILLFSQKITFRSFETGLQKIEMKIISFGTRRKSDLWNSEFKSLYLWLKLYIFLLLLILLITTHLIGLFNSP